MNELTATETQTTRKMSRLPSLLRLLGSVALLIAMYSFLARGWENGNDVVRYLIMLGHTGALAALGLASGRWLKEGKGARLFLSIALISVPVNFGILGAFVYSLTGNTTWLPQYLTWSISSVPTLIGLTAIAIAIITPMTLFSFRVLTRSMSTQLAGLYLLSNFALLIPMREPAAIALMVLLLASGVMILSKHIAKDQISASTKDGLLALTLQYLPLGVLLIRNLWLYHLDLYLLTLLVFAVYLLIRQLSFLYRDKSHPRSLLNALAILPAMVVIPCVWGVLAELSFFPDVLKLPVAGMASAILFYDISRREAVYSARYIQLAVCSLIVTTLLNTWAYSSGVADLISTVIGLSLLFTGYQRRSLSVLTGGSILFGMGLFGQVITLIHHFDFGSWFGLAILGVLTIVLASVLESPHINIRSHIQNVWMHLKTWEK